LASTQQGSTLVIGGGFGGMAAALRACALGQRVILLERGDRLGGRGRGFEQQGFHFDAGPTVVTAPHLFDELFALFGEQRADHLELLPLERFYRFHFHDGSSFSYGGDSQRTVEAIRAFAPGDEAGYLALVEHCRRIFEVGYQGLAHVPFHQLRVLLRHTPQLLRLGAWRGVHGAVSRHLRDDRLRRAFSTAPMLVGGHPYDTTSIYLLIHFLELKWGVWYPRGGVSALADSLTRLMERQGIEIRTRTTARRILKDGRGGVSGVELEGGEVIAGRRIISNADPMHLYQRMLAGTGRLAGLRRRTLQHSMGLFLLYFGVDRAYPEVDQHSIIFGRAFRQPLDEIFHHRRIPADFSLYLHRASAADPAMAPAGGESFYALVPVPNLSADLDWQVEGEALEQELLSRLEETLLPGLRQHIRVCRRVTPRHFSEELLSHLGCGFSIAPRFHQSAWFRFHNRSPHLRGLYLTGAGTHPGAGLPGVLNSAKVVEHLLKEDQDGF
jgi:phytoene desaturase